MKRLTALLLGIVLGISLVSCGESEKPEPAEPDVSQMRTICELSVMECYYHNVAKFFDEDAAGVLWWQKDKKFWIEYSGIVRVGVDASKVAMEVKGDRIIISLPEAKVLGCSVDETSLTKDSYIVAKGSAAVTAEDEVQAFKEAERQLAEAAGKDAAILSGARDRVQRLLQNYVENVVSGSEREYTIEWKYLEDTDEEEDDAQNEVLPESETPSDASV